MTTPSHAPSAGQAQPVRAQIPTQRGTTSGAASPGGESWPKRQLRRVYAAAERSPVGELATFVLKQAWAAIFGGLLLAAMALTAVVDLPWLHRHDWLFLAAVGIQVVLVATGLEKPREVVVICAFHLVGLGMELFKTHPAVGSWAYHDGGVFRVATVPLFSGFMYAAVGSYLARAHRVLELRYARPPARWAGVAVSVGIYVNFFTHHVWYDARWVLFAVLVAVYGRTWVHFRLTKTPRRMPLLVGFALIAAVIFAAENAATLLGAWFYPSQEAAWEPVHVGKFGSWLLLMVISFVLVDVLRGRQAPLAVTEPGGRRSLCS